MNRPAQRLDIVAMTRATDRAEAHVDRVIALAAAMEEDIDKPARIARGLCPSCYYDGSRMAGAAMTTQPCAACGVDQHYGSTATDALCLPCATEHSLCKRCGGDREMRVRRRKWPIFLAPKVTP